MPVKEQVADRIFRWVEMKRYDPESDHPPCSLHWKADGIYTLLCILRTVHMTANTHPSSDFLALLRRTFRQAIRNCLETNREILPNNSLQAEAFYPRNVYQISLCSRQMMKGRGRKNRQGMRCHYRTDRQQFRRADSHTPVH